MSASFGLAQQGDSIVKKGDLTFKDQEERTIFFQSTAGSTRYLELLLLSPQTYNDVKLSTVSLRIKICVDELREAIKGKSEEKQVKYIHQYVHRKFFTKYEYKNSFCDIFNNGYYNCVSSTALYALIFTDLGIPFQIMEKPSHVFLIAYPQSYKIFVETTSEEKGYMRFSDSFVKNYVDYLYAVHVIPQEDYDLRPASELFEKYFYSSTPVSMRSLVGMQYSNYSLYSADDHIFTVAAREMKKACYLDDCPRNRHLLKYMLAMEVRSNNYNEQNYVQDFAILCRLNALDNVDITDQNIRDEFQRLTQHQLIDRSDYGKYEASFNIIHKSLKDSGLKNDIAFSYHYNLARVAFIAEKSDKIIYEHLLGAYTANPEPADLRSLIIAQLSRKAEKMTEAQEILNLAKKFSSDFAFLATSNWLNGIRSNCVLQLGYQSYLLGNAVKGDNYLKEFESIVADDKTVEHTPAYVEKAYSEGATFYYKKGNVKRCRELLKKGLIYAPNSFALQMRLNQT
ncbi:hypothetical protein CNR22_04865 [Sphingobacteriaceae bacterium]|nr:hypothetical protein CNR22_04865 [Sphingobacteriaceae bacterium]